MWFLLHTFMPEFLIKVNNLGVCKIFKQNHLSQLHIQLYPVTTQIHLVELNCPLLVFVIMSEICDLIRKQRDWNFIVQSGQVRCGQLFDFVNGNESRKLISNSQPHPARAVIVFFYVFFLRYPQATK